MKVILVACCFLAATADAAPGLFDESAARTIRSGFSLLETINGTSQAYRSFFDTDNRIKQEEIGGLVEGKEDEGLVVKGTYSYIGDDGKNYTVQYTADKDGFHPQAEQLPPAPVQHILTCVLASACG